MHLRRLRARSLQRPRQSGAVFRAGRCVWVRRCFDWGLAVTDEELKAIEVEADGDCYNCFVLIAEIRRLRRLVKGANCDGWCVWCSNTMADGYHRDPDVHDADCEAFAPDGSLK